MLSIILKVSVVIEFLFQLFQLTALIVRGPVTTVDKFLISLDRVVVAEKEGRAGLLYVQDFVRSPHFSQRTFFFRL